MITNYKRVCEDGSDSVIFDERIGLIWSDRVNWARDLWVCSGSLRFLFPKTERAAVGAVLARRLISLIFAGRNRIIMIRRELPLTVIASPVEPVA